MTAQELFNYVASHLLRQNRKAATPEGVCKYRLEVRDAVLRCAIGCLIPGDTYTTHIEGEDIKTLISGGWLPQELVEHIDLLQELQEVHDLHRPKDWRKEIWIVALNNSLDPSVIYTLNPGKLWGGGE